jgi:hypothetical protein
VVAAHHLGDSRENKVPLRRIECRRLDVVDELQQLVRHMGSAVGSVNDVL